MLSSNTAPAGGPVFDQPYDVVRDACSDTFYVLHTASVTVAGAVRGRVVAVDGTTGVRSLFAAYTATAPNSNYSLLVRPFIRLPGPGGPRPHGGD